MNKKSEPIRSVLIVGGGSAGWIAATVLNAVMARDNLKITLLESSEIGSIGVGEATTPDILQFADYLRLTPEDFMRRCQATYKLGIRFVDWRSQNSEYWHPFGPVGGNIDGLDIFHFLHFAQRSGELTGSYDSYSVQRQLSTMDKGPRSLDKSSHIIDGKSYAYHLDATSFAATLKGAMLEAGLEHIYDEVSDVKVDDTGYIQSVSTVRGKELKADLYIDCTGKESLLIEKALHDPWIDWGDQLLCNRALVASAPSAEQVKPYTRATAAKAGWIWEIPLSHRMGLGYVHSDAFVAPDQASDELSAYAKTRGVKIGQPREIKFRVGRRQNFWRSNCVSIGLSAGFIEPLESTGIALAAIGTHVLTQTLPDCSMNPALISEYNRIMSKVYAEVRDFIILHYVLSDRDDSGFWQESRRVTLPDSLKQSLHFYEETGLLSHFSKEIFGEPSYYSIFSGNNHTPRRVLPICQYADLNRVMQVFENIDLQNKQFVENMPSNSELLSHIHRGRVQLL